MFRKEEKGRRGKDARGRVNHSVLPSPEKKKVSYILNIKKHKPGHGTLLGLTALPLLVRRKLYFVKPSFIYKMV